MVYAWHNDSSINSEPQLDKHIHSCISRPCWFWNLKFTIELSLLFMAQHLFWWVLFSIWLFWVWLNIYHYSRKTKFQPLSHDLVTCELSVDRSIHPICGPSTASAFDSCFPLRFCISFLKCCPFATKINCKPSSVISYQDFHEYVAFRPCYICWVVQT